jgi:hypothetical protein
MHKKSLLQAFSFLDPSLWSLLLFVVRAPPPRAELSVLVAGVEKGKDERFQPDFKSNILASDTRNIYTQTRVTS